MERLIVIAGPTAIGKTNISIAVAKKINGEIISADSMQIYKDMDIGTSKITKKEMDGITHHMIDILDPKDEFTVAEYKEKASGIIDHIIKKKKVPIMVGGTGLYINAVVTNMTFTKSIKDDNIRAELLNLANTEGKESLFNILKKVDKKSSEKIHMNNVKRVIRAIEVFKVTGIKFSEFQNETREEMYNTYYYLLNSKREEIYERINKRVDIMIETGLFNEVESLIKNGCRKEMQSMQGIGYKEIVDFFNGNITKEEAVEKIKQGSRNYAKRQLTWFKNDGKFSVVDVNEEDVINKIINDFYK